MVENGNPKMCNLKTGGFVDISLFVDSDLIICDYFDCIFLSLLPITLGLTIISFLEIKLIIQKFHIQNTWNMRVFFSFLRISSITHKLIKINVVV